MFSRIFSQICIIYNIITFGIYNFLGKLTVLRTVAEIDPQYIQNFLGIIQSEKL